MHAGTLPETHGCASFHAMTGLDRELPAIEVGGLHVFVYLARGNRVAVHPDTSEHRAQVVGVRGNILTR